MNETATIILSSGVALIGGILIGKYLLKEMQGNQASVQVPTSSAGTTTPDDADAAEVAPEPYKMVLLCRNDLKMTKGKVCAQCGHGTLGAYRKAEKRNPKALRFWLDNGQPKIALRINSEKEMDELYEKAVQAGLIAHIVADAGHTQIAPGSRTVLAIGPGPESTINSICGHLKLF